jgi:predicted esterase
MADAGNSRALPEEVISALEQAGDNKAELLSALDKVPVEQKEAMEFLVVNMPDCDLKTLSAEFLLENADLAYRALQETPWAKQIPREIFLNDLLPYANVNERRDAWRKDFHERFGPTVKSCKTPAEAAELLNRSIFKELKVKYSRKRPKADQSPHESMDAGLASCTGLSILLIDACRAVGVPARFAGTPLWADRSGNHSWVEIWDNGWHFTGAAEPGGKGLDHGWFAHKASMAKHDPPRHAIYAVSYKRTPLRFPLVWNRSIDYVHAVDVTDRYTQDSKPPEPGKSLLSIRVFDRRNGSRVAAKVTIKTAKDGQIIFQGTSKDERFDLNDDLAAQVPINEEYNLELHYGNRRLNKTLRPKEQEVLVVVNLPDRQEPASEGGHSPGEQTTFTGSPAGEKLAGQLKEYFDAPPGDRHRFEFDADSDALLLEHGKVIRKMVWEAYRSGYRPEQMAHDLEADRVTFQEYVSPYVVRKVGARPENGWPLFIAMHGGGGAPKRVNDSQWRVMQHYYRDQNSVEGYLYLAIRAPNDKWNGFYDWYNLRLTENLIRQFLLFEDVNPNKICLMGYSHGGYGAFYIGPKMADRFAAVHASAAAPTPGHCPARNLRNAIFTYMVGERDNRYGRLKRCQKFNDEITQLRGEHKDIYPVTMEYKPGYGHSGLPDRDKIKDMYTARRDPIPRHVAWELTDSTVKYFHWLHVPDPAPGKEIEAICEDNRITVSSRNLSTLHLLLDERSIDFSKSVVIESNGNKTATKLKPSLKTLCETLQARGDPEYMFAIRLTLTIEAAEDEEEGAR